MAYRQCAGVTRKGNRCQNGAMPHSAYCGSHTDAQPVQVKFDRMGYNKPMSEESSEMNGLVERQQMLYRMFEIVADRLGKWGKGIDGDGAHYVAKSPFAGEGMVCSNCSFFQGGRMCEIVAGDIAPEAICKLWVIRDGLLKSE